LQLLRGNRLDLATALSVMLSAAVGIVGNFLVDAWGWPLLAAFVVLVVCLVGLEIVRHRAGAALRGPAGPEPAPPYSVQQFQIGIAGSKGAHVAGRDIYRINVGGGTLLGVISVFGVALLLSGTVVTLGRRQEASDRTRSPTVTTSTVSPADTGPPPATVPDDFTYDGVRLIDPTPVDLDPPRATRHLPDVYFRYDPSGFSFVNGAAVASVPPGQLSASGCSSATGWATHIGVADAKAVTSKCLRTSDGRYGTLTTTSTIADINGGSALINWTVWYS
jgi:hypothetical protein